MTALGLLIAIGAIMSIYVFGGGSEGYFYLAGGIIIALSGVSWLRNKLKISNTKKQSLYFASFLLVFLSLLIIPGFMFTSLLPSEEINAGLKRSQNLIQKGKYDAAEQILKNLSDKYYDNPELHQNLSAVYLRQGEADKAYQELMTMQKNADMCFNYGLSFYQKETYLDASAYFEKAIMLNPDMFKAYLYAGESHFRMQEYPAAAYFFANAKNISQNSPEAYYHCAKAQLQLMELDKAYNNLAKAKILDREGRFSPKIDELYGEVEDYRSKIESLQEGR